MTEKDERRRRGRPPLAEGVRKRANLTFRVRDELRDRLARAAELSGRSVSEEIEHRLEQSFIEEAVRLAMPPWERWSPFSQSSGSETKGLLQQVETRAEQAIGQVEERAEQVIGLLDQVESGTKGLLDRLAKFGLLDLGPRLTSDEPEILDRLAKENLQRAPSQKEEDEK